MPGSASVRPFGGSTIADRDQDAAPDLVDDDVCRVLEAVTAHEPSLALLLPDAEEARAKFQAIFDTYRTSGIGAASQQVFSFTGLEVPAQGEDTAPQPPSAEMVATSERCLGHGPLSIALHQPDIATLQAGAMDVRQRVEATSVRSYVWIGLVRPVWCGCRDASPLPH